MIQKNLIDFGAKPMCTEELQARVDELFRQWTTNEWYTMRDLHEDVWNLILESRGEL